MTRLPSENRKVKGVEGPLYNVNTVCAQPFCQEKATEIHHLWRRSFLVGDYAWVEFEDGTKLPNLCGLCSEHHREVTENKAEVLWSEGEGDYKWFAPGVYTILDPSPLDGAYGKDEWGAPPSAPAGAVGSVEPGGVGLKRAEAKSGVLGKTSATPGSTCPLCQRRIPHPKKDTSPKTKTFSYRVPVDDAGVHDEILSAAARHLGIYQDPHWRWQLATRGAALILQGPPE